mmetsp:Transcript_47602/g.115923  ORF Transcript_47602/g.115923 Transcript_47602/m.115923 type:complete len:514 (+) Transcript_47602:282-1823(+)
MNAMYPRDGMGSFLDVGLGDLGDGGANSGLASQFQCEYQELGLDPVVSNLNLDSAHPTIHHLAQATQANAASSLMALHKQDMVHGSLGDQGMDRSSRRPEHDSPPNKKARTGYSSKSAQRETPVRDRHDGLGSPERAHRMSGFESPVAGHDSAYSTPTNGVTQTPPGSPGSSRNEDDAMRHAAATILGKPGRNGRLDGSPLHGRSSTHDDLNAPRTPDSEENQLSPPPSASSKGKAKARTGGRTMQTPAQTPLANVDKNKKDKGLREFSLRVCRQVEAKMVTTYNEVADELVKEFKNDDPAGDEKNIRRRAYDALNVLTAMDIISKDKKDIQWKGFPNLSADGQPEGERRTFSSSGGDSEKERLRQEIADKQKEVSQKETQLEDLSLQYLSLLQLLQRNAADTSEAANKHRIYLPFVLVSTDYDNTIECDISNDKQTAQFNFTKPFELHDDRETLNMMEMYACDEGTLREHLPAHLADFIKSRRADVVSSSSRIKRECVERHPEEDDEVEDDF